VLHDASGLPTAQTAQNAHDASENAAPQSMLIDVPVTIVTGAPDLAAPIAQSQRPGAAAEVAMPTSRRAIVAMQSKARDAERRFRAAIVSMDAIPGSQIEGISPLYHVSSFDGPDSMTAVMQLTTTMPPRALAATLESIGRAGEGAVELRLVDMEGARGDEADCMVPLPLADAASQAAVLAPWLDMDPEASLGGKPVSFLLALAPDAMQVGLLSDNWIIGETQ
jgi:dihydroneopterin aldolase/2-amino-4-hydroxy-6-hydroxymethyldihydropteridine diphosphokinase